jgi:hypothetical protein
VSHGLLDRMTHASVFPSATHTRSSAAVPHIRTRWTRPADADPDIADKDGVTPLQHAADRGFTEIAALLERA